MPEQVTCMKKGKLAREAYEKVFEIWNAEKKSSKNDEAQNPFDFYGQIKESVPEQVICLKKD